LTTEASKKSGRVDELSVVDRHRVVGTRRVRFEVELVEPEQRERERERVALSVIPTDLKLKKCQLINKLINSPSALVHVSDSFTSASHIPRVLLFTEFMTCLVSAYRSLTSGLKEFDLIRLECFQ